jgi:curved DNA-binding protein CbpA
MGRRTGSGEAVPAMSDHYATLQVDPRADPEVIEAAYRRLARKWHPDRSADPGAPARMRAINEAYHVLGDARRRRAYDARLAAAGTTTATTVSSVLGVVAAVIGVLFATRILGFLVRVPLLLLLLGIAVYALLQGGRSARRRGGRGNSQAP